MSVDFLVNLRSQLVSFCLIDELSTFHFDLHFSSFFLRCLRLNFSFWNHFSVSFKTIFLSDKCFIFEISVWPSVPVKFLDKVNIVTELLITSDDVVKNEVKQDA